MEAAGLIVAICSGWQDTISTEVDDQFSFEPKESRVTFVSGEDVWALRFPSTKTFDAFLQKFNAALFENRFGEDRSKADKVRTCSSCCEVAGWLRCIAACIAPRA